jgi:hypothetical protein
MGAYGAPHAETAQRNGSRVPADLAYIGEPTSRLGNRAGNGDRDFPLKGRTLIATTVKPPRDYLVNDGGRRGKEREKRKG